jgi:hypothetical protein
MAKHTARTDVEEPGTIPYGQSIRGRQKAFQIRTGRRTRRIGATHPSLEPGGDGGSKSLTPRKPARPNQQIYEYAIISFQTRPHHYNVNIMADNQRNRKNKISADRVGIASIFLPDGSIFPM